MEAPTPGIRRENIGEQNEGLNMNNIAMGNSMHL